jgi:hypothetical protein
MDKIATEYFERLMSDKPLIPDATPMDNTQYGYILDELEALYHDNLYLRKGMNYLLWAQLGSFVTLMVALLFILNKVMG